MSPHISQAVELLTEKARQHQARLDLARRTYVRTLVLNEPTHPQTLADAVETLGIPTADFLKDAQSGQLHRDSIALIPKLEIEIRDRRDLSPPPESSDLDDVSFTPDPILLKLENQLDLARRHRVEGPRRSPRLFSAEAQKLLQTPINPTPPPVDSPASEPSDLEPANLKPANSISTSKTPTPINAPYAW